MKVAGSPDAPLSRPQLMIEAVYGDAGILWGERNDHDQLDLKPHAHLMPNLTTRRSVAYVRPEKPAEDRALFELFDAVIPPPNDDAAHV